MDAMTTGDVANRTGVSQHTLRYYEERGLLPEPPRTSAGYRKYNEEHVAHIHFIKRAQQLGFTLAEIRDLLSLRASSESGEEVRVKTAAKIAEIDEKIRDLTSIREKLSELTRQCNKHGSSDSCLVFHALESPPNE
jgi:DNA-binding transcriptional MerR regulator